VDGDEVLGSTGIKLVRRGGLIVGYEFVDAPDQDDAPPRTVTVDYSDPSRTRRRGVAFQRTSRSLARAARGLVEERLTRAIVDAIDDVVDHPTLEKILPSKKAIEAWRKSGRMRAANCISSAIISEALACAWTHDRLGAGHTVRRLPPSLRSGVAGA
jgi:hypothetical protein